MSTIRPISDLRNHADQISDLCHKQGEPVFITKNGHGDLVVMSHSLYEKQQALLDTYQKLEQAEQESRRGVKKISHRKMIRTLRQKLA